MEPNITLDPRTLKALIKESIREVMREQWLTFFERLLPYIDDDAQAEIAAQFSPTAYPDEDFTDITHWAASTESKTSNPI